MIFNDLIMKILLKYVLVFNMFSHIHLLSSVSAILPCDYLCLSFGDLFIFH